MDVHFRIDYILHLSCGCLVVYEDDSCIYVPNEDIK